MKVFLDTNIFFGDWFARSAAFRYLFHFLNNAGHELLLSRLVIEEVENTRRREIDTEMDAATKSLAALARLNGSPLQETPSKSMLAAYDILALLRENVENLTVIEYEHVAQSAVVERALAIERPFRENEKGYRDTVIWLSLLEHIKAEPKATKVAFISQNTTDFFSGSKDVSFHSDLLADLKSIPIRCSITPFSNLSAFVDSEIDKSKHAIDYAKAEPLFESYLEDESVSYLTSLEASSVKRLQGHILPYTNALANLSGVSAEIYEGMEDFSITSTSEISHSEVYVACEYNVRMVQLGLFIPTHDFEANQASIEESEAVYETEPIGKTIAVKAVIRPYFSASFSYDRNTGKCDGFSVSHFHIR